MICSDQRIVDICTELFRFLKSDKEEAVVHTKHLKKIDKKSVIQTEIDIGFLTIRMVWKPYNFVNGSETGSDEGANLFVYLPFKDNSSDANSNQAMFRGYYSERGTNRQVTAILSNDYTAHSYGARRVVQDLKPLNNSPI